MTTSLMPEARQRYYNNDGTVAAGCLLYTYAAGTTTPKATYTDSAGLVPHANPIVLDAKGEAVIFWDGAYKVDLKTAAGVQITGYPVDNYAPPTDTLRTDLADTDGATLVGFSHSATYASGTVGSKLKKKFVWVTDAPFNAIGDSTNGTDGTDDTAAFEAARDYVATSGGMVGVPAGFGFKLTNAIAMADGVDFVGMGADSIVYANGCGAFTYAFTRGFGNSQIRNMSIQGVSATTQIGIYQAGTLDDADELYGITIDGCLIRGFNTSIKFRTVRNVTITNNWLQDTNGGIHLVGKCLVVNIHNNKIVYAAGSGTGTQYAILCDSFDYTSGTGVVRPESVRTSSNHIYGFENGISFAGVVYGVSDENDVQATQYGIRWSSASAVLNIRGGYVQISGASAVAGAWGQPQASVIDTKVNVEGVHFNAVNTTAGTTIGLRLGSSGSGNQDNVRAVGNSFTGFTLYDMAAYASGNIHFAENECYSTAVTSSIYTTGIPSGRPVYVRGNDCADSIDYDASDYRAGRLQLGTNVISGSTISGGNSGAWETPTFSAANFTGNAAMTWTVGAGNVESYAYNQVGNRMTVLFNVSTTTVGGTPNSRLQIAIPDGKTATKRASTAVGVIVDNGVRTTGFAEVQAGGTIIEIGRTDNAAFSAATDATTVHGQITFEID